MAEKVIKVTKVPFKTITLEMAVVDAEKCLELIAEAEGEGEFRYPFNTHVQDKQERW